MKNPLLYLMSILSEGIEHRASEQWRILKNTITKSTTNNIRIIYKLTQIKNNILNVYSYDIVLLLLYYNLNIIWININKNIPS